MSKGSLILVTQNKHKLRELRPLFEEYGIELATTTIPKLEIRSNDVERVALEAAKIGFFEAKQPVVLDDTALYIDALEGFPMTYAGFVLKTLGRKGILKLMDGVKDRRARFATAVGFSDGETLATFKGVMEGSIAEKEEGEDGFAYDPIFIPEGESRTYAQLSFEEKVKISHRTKAFRAFFDWYTVEF
ncbi:MAG: RdgB/HAM1 family non-canonical purine NTP pyrophosphatase [Candidatus Thorarchaeota archaeon]|jgi:XTP/dITP diphosphohydrolase